MRTIIITDTNAKNIRRKITNNKIMINKNIMAIHLKAAIPLLPDALRDKFTEYIETSS